MTKVKIEPGTDFNESPEKPVTQHNQILNGLLKQIQPIDVREFLKIPDEEKIKQKYIVVAVIKHLLEIAKKNNWNLCKANDYVYIFNGAYWQQLDKEDLKQFLGKCAIQTGSPPYEALHHEFKEKLFKQFLSDSHLPQPPIDKNKILINFQNGTGEFTNGKFIIRDFKAEDFLTYQLPFPYNPSAEAAEFSKYLSKVLPEKSSQDVMQEFCGYIFTKLNLEKMLMLTGTGANGKSVFFNILCALLGRQNVLTYSLGLFSHEYNRVKLTNVLLNYSSEKGTELNADTFKALVSGEPLQAREPYGKSFTLYNTVRFIINANELPKETEQTEAYFRRWIIIPFDVTIPTDERDTELSNRIIENELAGVFNWLLIGLNRIVENKKFTFSEKAHSALGNFRRQSDSVALFTDELNYQKSDTEKEALTELYLKYKSFCFDDGYKPVGKNKFSHRLENLGFEKTRNNIGGTAFFLTNLKN